MSIKNAPVQVPEVCDTIYLFEIYVSGPSEPVQNLCKAVLVRQHRGGLYFRLEFFIHLIRSHKHHNRMYNFHQTILIDDILQQALSC